MSTKTPSTFPYVLRIAGISIPCLFCFPDTAMLFGDYLSGPSQNKEGIHVPSAEWLKWQSDGGSMDAAAEFTCFTACTSDALLHYGCAIIHAVCFKHRGHAWLICAPSGVGKTTQIKALQALYPGEFSVICGDRTVLQLSGQQVYAHPSPWNGKEGFHGADSAPLAGILCLERGETTSLVELSSNEAVIPVLKALISTYSTPEVVHQLASFETELLNRIPVWRYINGGIPDSSRILYECLLRRRCLG